MRQKANTLYGIYIMARPRRFLPFCFYFFTVNEALFWFYMYAAMHNVSFHDPYLSIIQLLIFLITKVFLYYVKSVYIIHLMYNQSKKAL